MSTPAAPNINEEDKKKVKRISAPGSVNWPIPASSTLELEERFQLCLSVGEECLTPEGLRNLLEHKANPICYDGFEPSGRMHIAQGLQKAINVNKLTKAGCVFVFWVADWFALLNNKMGGDLKKIQTVGRYFIEVWKAAGMNMENVRFLWASEEINADPSDYWLRVIDIARNNSISRVKRCGQIMGREEGDEQASAQIMYPCMQCADIFYLKADICQLGMDQRKVNVLAREYCDTKKIKNKPIVLSHEMLPGLLSGQEKMSKSNPDSAIWMEDPETEVSRKIKKAFCPPAIVDGNPCVKYVQLLVLPYMGEFLVKRSAENGGDKTYTNIEELRTEYTNGALHPADLKSSLATAVNKMLEPVRKHFKEDADAKALLDLVTKYKVTK